MDGETLLISLLHASSASGSRILMRRFLTPGLVFHLAASEPPSCLIRTQPGCQRAKVGSGANDKLLINLREIKRNL